MVQEALPGSARLDWWASASSTCQGQLLALAPGTYLGHHSDIHRVIS